MKFTVSKKQPNVTLGIILALIGLAGIAGVTVLQITAPEVTEDGTFPLLIGGFALFAALGIFSVYCGLRPCVKVDGDHVMYYPRWKKKRTVSLDDIAKKLTFNRADDSTPTYGVAGYCATGGKSAVLSEMVYYDADKNELLRFTSNMKNFTRLDSLIAERLQARQEKETPTEE